MDARQPTINNLPNITVYNYFNIFGGSFNVIAKRGPVFVDDDDDADGLFVVVGFYFQGG